MVVVGGRGGGGVLGTGGGHVDRTNNFFPPYLALSPGLSPVLEPCLREDIPESRLEGVSEEKVGEEREGDSGTEGVDDPQRRWREETG